MNKYTIYHSTDGVLATGKPYPADEGAEIPNLDPELTLLLEVTEAKPTYDSATHKLVENAIAYDTTAKTATRSWSAAALTQAEIAERTPAHVEINGIKWKTDEASQAAFSSMTLLLDKAGMADTDMVAIKDAHNVTQPMTVAQYQADAITYGLHCYTIFHG
jgi:hypothetical protein